MPKAGYRWSHPVRDYGWVGWGGVDRGLPLPSGPYAGDGSRGQQVPGVHLFPTSCSVMSRWLFEIGHGGRIYIT